MTPSMRLNFNGWHDLHSGYGKANLKWMTWLERLTKGGVSVEWEREHSIKNAKGKYNDEQMSVVTKPFTLERIGVIQSTPDFFVNCHSDYRIGYTMVENTHVGKKWVGAINKMDHLFVPSTQLVDVFEKYGVKVPITVMPEGYDPEEYKFIERYKRDVFTFLMVGWLDERKNWETMVQAFMSEFAPDEPVRFIFKNSNPQFGYEMPVDKRIKVIDRRLTEKELVDLYGLADCFVFTTRAEGFGLPALEAMATGLPVILTNWLGSADMCDDRYNYSIDPIDLNFRIVRPDQQGWMANIDPQELMYWMRHVYEYQDEAKEKGKLAAKWVKNNWTWKHAAKRMIKVLDGILKEIGPSWKEGYEFSGAWINDEFRQNPEYLKRFVGEKIKVVQVGAYEGTWTIWALTHLLTHPDSKLVDIDCWESQEKWVVDGELPLEKAKDRYFKNLKKSPHAHKVKTMVEKSENALKKLYMDDYDLVYIDGSHLAKDVAVDARLGFRILKVGGVLMFDDYMWNMGMDVSQYERPHEAINEFLVEYWGHYNLIHKGEQLVIEKTKNYD